MKKYRLKKDWLIPTNEKMMVGDIFEEETEWSYYNKRLEYRISAHLVENVDWFEEVKPERIEVKEIMKHSETYSSGSIKYSFKTFHEIPESKFPAIKKVIEDVLNEKEDNDLRVTAIKESDRLFKIGNKYYVEDGYFGPHKFTEEDVKDAIANVLTCDMLPFMGDTNLSLVDNHFNRWLKQRIKQRNVT